MAALTAIMDFQFERFKLILIYKSHLYFLPSIKLIGLSVQEKRKIDFQNGGHGSHLGCPIWIILAFCYLQNTFTLPTNNSSQFAFRSWQEVKNIFFKTADLAAISDFKWKSVLGIFNLQVTLLLPTKC